MKRFICIVSLLCLCLASCASADGKNETAAYKQISQDEAQNMMEQDDGHVIVDVRRQDEYDAGHIPGAILIPNEEISDTQPSELPDLDQIILIYCRSGNRSKQAAQKLADMGYTNIYEFGGINTWTGEIVTGESENAETEEAGLESSGTAARSAETAVLTFDSFDGGGHEYTVEIEDPSVIEYTSKRDYGSANYEEEDGSPFTMIFTFTGIKPGRTTVSIYGRSPIMENEDSFYEAVVDEELNVTLTSMRRISTLDLYRNADIYYPSYKIWMDTDGYVLSVDEEEEYPVSGETMDALMQVVETYGLDQWDGFDEEETGVLDGEGFWLEIRFSDGTSIEAHGDNAFPEHYFEAMGSIQELIDQSAGRE